MRECVHYLFGVQAFGHGPRGDHIIHDAFAERLRHLVQLHEFAHIIQHVVVLRRRGGHLLDDGRHVTEYRRVQQRYMVLQSGNKKNKKQN